MRAAFYTLGCKVNQYETAVLMQQFAAAGYDIVEPESDADVYVVNSCTVTAAGDKKSRQALRRFKRQNPAAVACLTGCFPQAFPDLAERIPEADVITGSKNRAGLLAAVQQRLAGGERVIDITPHKRGDPFEPMQTDRSARTRAFVKIQDGCERYCAYCIIPTARGPVRSRPPEQLRSELQTLAAAGYREVVLAGINLSCYGRDLGSSLLEALRIACAVPGLARVRLGSLEPELLSPGEIAAMAELPGLCPQFHLSLQSGCDTTLARMRRQYDTAEYRRIAAGLRAAFPGCALTTDIMVGFPGETPAEFAQSLAFVREIAFAKAHIFAYSARPGTRAATMPDQVPPAEKTRRAAEMAGATQLARADFLQAQVGTHAVLLAEQRLADGRWEGYTENYTPLCVQAPADLAGQLCPVTITGVERLPTGEERCTAVLAQQQA